MDLNKVDRRRRAFLRASAGAGALGTLAALAQPVQGAPAAPSAQPEPPEPKGYHETDHIRTYYRTAAYW
jgi:anaerobic selenocysteine-containing dehydrogenase